MKVKELIIGDYFESFINERVKSGKFSSPDEVIRAALRLFEQEEIKTKNLINELKEGEKSEMIADFDKKQMLNNLHATYL